MAAPFFISVVLAFQCAFGQDVQQSAKPLSNDIEGSICHLGSEKRNLHLVPVDDKYDVKYSKMGQEQSVGKLKSKDSGVAIIRRISKNLVDGGWTCREVKKFEVSTDPSDTANE